MTTQAHTHGVGEFNRHGFTVEHPDDHLLFLVYGGKRIAVFSQIGATEESIHKECQKHLTRELKKWNLLKLLMH